MSDTYTSVPELFGSLVFGDAVMRERLPKPTYQAIRKAIHDGTSLDISVANTVAAAMKEWAVEQGATHFTHWFQPMTGFTAEKHDSFISPTGDGRVLMEFSGKELVKGEPDASSFPSGGLRDTYEARGYTAWDPSSPAFVKDGSLYIPTAFCSYGGQALDKKTPLLRSADVLNRSALRILHLLGYTDVTKVDVTVGCEQEYFLIDKDFYKKRKDLVFCGRTLLGAAPPKGQEMEDHYFGVLKPKIAAFMHDLDTELWKLGVPAKTKHNEVAPAQYEMAPVFEISNIATDHNQLTMEMLKKVADRHGFACLLHEKPFDGVNGSGKHDNWSLVTDTGENLLNPGKTPAKNTRFLVFLTAIIAAVDDYAGLLRASVATAGNDHRLGGNEAPPAVISMFVGDELEQVLESIEEDRDMTEGHGGMMELAKMLPLLKQDNTDRNRTSPFAFTGNKFEFRMPGSSLSAADPNIVLNTAVAEELDRFYEALRYVPDEALEDAVHRLIKETIQAHRRIVFNGNGYTDAWIEEAARRGLPNLHSVPEAAEELLKKQNMELCISHGIYTEEEILSRHAIMLENYIKTIHIEALTLRNMVTKDFTDGLLSYMKAVETEMLQKKQVLPDLPCNYEIDILKTLNACAEQLSILLDALSQETENAESIEDLSEKAHFYHDVILSEMSRLRAAVDAAEARVPGSFIPYPTYEEMLFHLRKYDA